MVITLLWDGQPISNCNPKAAITALGLSPEASENLWALWCAIDAILDEEDDAEKWIGAEGEELADMVGHPDFTSEAMRNDTFDWDSLSDWVRAHADKLTTTARLA